MVTNQNQPIAFLDQRTTGLLVMWSAIDWLMSSIHPISHWTEAMRMPDLSPVPLTRSLSNLHSMKRAASLNYLNKSIEDPYQVRLLPHIIGTYIGLH